MDTTGCEDADTLCDMLAIPTLEQRRLVAGWILRKRDLWSDQARYEERSRIHWRQAAWGFAVGTMAWSIIRMLAEAVSEAG